MRHNPKYSPVDVVTLLAKQALPPGALCGLPMLLSLAHSSGFVAHPYWKILIASTWGNQGMAKQ